MGVTGQDMFLIVDAYNALAYSHFLPDAHAMASGTALARLIDVTGVYGGVAVVVCDGKPKPDDDADAALGRSRVVFSGPGRDADEVIEGLVRKHSAPRRVMVVSNDRQVQKAARRRRAGVMESEKFMKALGKAIEGMDASGKKRDLARRNEVGGGRASDTEVKMWMEAFGYGEAKQEEGIDEEGLREETRRWLREFGYLDWGE